MKFCGLRKKGSLDDWRSPAFRARFCRLFHSGWTQPASRGGRNGAPIGVSDLGVGQNDVAVLYVGRLSRHGKAHPLPMMAALGSAARMQPHPLHLILAGWWLHPPEEKIWRDQAAVLCPEVRLHLLDGRDEAVQREIWSAADVFTLLVDNVQETFGLAPVEAMAAGLPVVVTDWDGFRDTVRHGVDGFLVPTLMAPPGDGLEAALCYATWHINYGAWLSVTARLTAVDIGAAAQVFISWPSFGAQATHGRSGPKAGTGGFSIGPTLSRNIRLCGKSKRRFGRLPPQKLALPCPIPATWMRPRPSPPGRRSPWSTSRRLRLQPAAATARPPHTPGLHRARPAE